MKRRAVFFSLIILSFWFVTGTVFSQEGLTGPGSHPDSEPSLMTAARISSIAGGAVSLGFGVWHLFVPELYGWNSYLEQHPPELKKAVNATNFFFGISLSLLGGWSILMPTFFKDSASANLAWSWTMAGLWTIRSVYQIFNPQGSEVPGLSIGMLIGFIVTDLLFLFPALVQTAL